MKAIQYIESYPTEQDAHEGADFLASQVGLLAVRVLSATYEHKWRTQAIFEHHDGPDSLPLPDGCRIVFWRGHF